MIQANYALEQEEARALAKSNPEVPAPLPKRPLGPSICYRFLKDAKGWRVFISTELPKVDLVSVKVAGAIGIDINADCVAMAETDRFGNLVGTRVFPLVTYGKSSDQAEAIIGDVVKEIVAKAVEAGKPIVMEKLDFSKKKGELNGEDPRYARMLSSLTYNGIKSGIKARAFKNGIEVIEVNRAYCSIQWSGQLRRGERLVSTSSRRPGDSKTRVVDCASVRLGVRPPYRPPRVIMSPSHCLKE